MLNCLGAKIKWKVKKVKGNKTVIFLLAVKYIHVCIKYNTNYTRPAKIKLWTRVTCIPLVKK